MECLSLGDLKSQQKQMRLQKGELRALLCQILSALAYLHDSKTSHRDIKPENIMVARRGPTFCAKLADFGLSKANSIFGTYCGTEIYMAPEILGRIPYSDKVDVWALGLIALELSTAESIPKDVSLVRCQQIASLALRLSCDSKDPLATLISKMVEFDAEIRPTAQEAFDEAMKSPPVEIFAIPQTTGNSSTATSGERSTLRADMTVRQQPSLTVTESTVRQGTLPWSQQSYRPSTGGPST